MEHGQSFELLMAEGRSGKPVMEGIGEQGAAAHMQRQEPVEEQHLLDLGEDPNLLPRQRWGVVAPEGKAGDELLGHVRELVAWRRECQEGRPVLEYRVPASLAASAEKDPALLSRWKNAVLDDPAVKVIDRPRYLLLLGDLDQVPFELQKALATDRLAGRLAFPDAGGYQSYVEKVLRREKQPQPAPPPRVLFYTVRDGTQATNVGYDALMKPAVTEVREALREDEGLSDQVLGERVRELGTARGARVEDLLAEARRPEPTILFSMSHGLGPPREGWGSVGEKRALQGAMSLGGGQRLEAEALAKGPFLPGGLWLFFACFGAGTPTASAYWPWLKKLKEAGQFRGELQAVLDALPAGGERPFIASLPQAALANPEGPLAVIGHVDLAWTYGFQDRSSGGSRRDRFTEVLMQWLAGRRAGVGTGWLSGGELGKVSSELMMLYSQQETNRQLARPDPVDPALMAHLWMTRQDLGGYVLLGDPAVRLVADLAPPPPARIRLVAPVPAQAHTLEEEVQTLDKLRAWMARAAGVSEDELFERERLHRLRRR